MPIFRANSKLVYFAHVPKCAGTSMLQYLQSRFGAVAFHDGSFHAVPEEYRWSRTSPQHIDAKTLARMFPEGFFDASFAIVRHPVSRLISAFHFQREVERIVTEDEAFGTWIARIAEKRAKDPFLYDNHTRAMDEIVPDGAKVFHLEDGSDQFIDWLDKLASDEKGPRTLPRVNERKATGHRKTGKTMPTADDIELIAKIYARDFERFGYEPHTYRHGRSSPSRGAETRPTPIKGILRAIGLS